MCYRCANTEALIALAAAAASLDNIAGGEQAQRALCNVINEVGNQFANDLADERLGAKQEPALAAGNKLHEEMTASMKVRDEVGAGPVKQETGAGEVTDQRTKDFMS
jgi:hypothetical protein